MTSRFFIKGSYVLDVVFETTFANDIDVFFQRGHSPSRSDVLEWLRHHGLAAEKEPDFTPTDDLEECSGGDFPVFNIDRWHIRPDGQLYTLEETDEPREEPEVAHVQTAKDDEMDALIQEECNRDELQTIARAAADQPLGGYRMQSRPLTRDEALATKLGLLRDLPTDGGGLNHVRKVLLKLTYHPSLHTPEMWDALTDHLANAPTAR